MAFADEHHDLAAQIDLAVVSKQNIVAAIRYLASAVEDGQHDTMRQRIEQILTEQE